VADMPAGFRVSSVGRRLGQYLLEIALVIVTLIIGYIVWSLIIWSRGETPGMHVLHMKCVKKDTGQVATWGTMALREIVGKILIMGVISFIPLASVILDFMLLWDRDRQELWDKVAGTIVVDVPAGMATQ
jgi:uncharacterized RDD family membrane protein YckC